MGQADQLVIDEMETKTLINGFSNIKSTLNLNDANLDISTATVGHQSIIEALADFNEQVSRTKNKYQRKTDNFIEFLKEVESGSDELDQQLTDAITVSEEGE